MTDTADSSLTPNAPNYQARLLRLPGREADGLIFIEQLHAGEAIGCKNERRPFLLSWNEQKRVAVIWRPDCNMWTCPHCGEKRRKWVVARGYAGAAHFVAQKRSMGFVTITSHEKLNAEGSVRVWPKAWNKLRMRLKREVPATEYLFVPELHKNGRMHAHGLVIDAPGKRWWKDNARECGFGFQDDMQEALDLSVVGYLAKYTGKMLQFSNLPKGTRRFRASQGWPKMVGPDKDQNVQTIVIDKHQPYAHQIAKHIDASYDVIWEFSNNFWDYLSDRSGE